MAQNNNLNPNNQGSPSHSRHTSGSSLEGNYSTTYGSKNPDLRMMSISSIVAQPRTPSSTAPRLRVAFGREVNFDLPTQEPSREMSGIEYDKPNAAQQDTPQNGSEDCSMASPSASEQYRTPDMPSQQQQQHPSLQRNGFPIDATPSPKTPPDMDLWYKKPSSHAMYRDHSAASSQFEEDTARARRVSRQNSYHEDEDEPELRRRTPVRGDGGLQPYQQEQRQRELAQGLAPALGLARQHEYGNGSANNHQERRGRPRRRYASMQDDEDMDMEMGESSEAFIQR